MFAILVSSGGLCLVPGQAVASARGSPSRESAEKLYAAGRLAEAHRAYRFLQTRHPSAADKTWIDFRLADTEWRVQVAKRLPDEAVIDAARESLEAQLRGLSSSGARTRVFAELNESIAELWLERPREGPSWDYPQRARHYLAAARKWWLENPGEPGRNARFLALFWLSQKQMEPQLPVNEMREALSLARSDEERAHLHLLIAMALSGGFQPPVDDVVREYEAGLAIGPTKWRQNLLFSFASFMQYCGKPEAQTSGRIECKPDNDRALALYAELKEDIARHGSTSTYHVDQEIARIAGPVATLVIPGAFLPGEPIDLTLYAKNLSQYELALYELHLPQDLPPPGDPGIDQSQWRVTTPLTGRTPIRAWRQPVADRHFEGSYEKIRLEPLNSGFYVLQVRSDAGESRWPLLVSDISLLLTRIGDRSSLFVTRPRDGSAVVSAEIMMFHKSDSSGWGSTLIGSDHFGLVELPDQTVDSLFVARRNSDVAILKAYPPQKEDEPDAAVYAFTSKSDYRPGDEVAVLFQALKPGRHGTTGTAGELEYDIRIGDAKVSSGAVALDELGAGHVSFKLRDKTAPGIYRIRFPGLARPGSRPEERSLFRVVEMPPSDLRVEVIPSSPFPRPPYGGGLLGALVRVERDGKPVAGAFLEVAIVKRTFAHAVGGRRLDRATQGHWKLSGTTDDSGEAVFSFPAQAWPQCEFEYEIQVTACSPDNARGFGRGRIRAAPFSRLSLDRSVVRSGEKVALRIATFDAEGNPTRFEGVVTGTRRTWTEAWTRPDGTVVRGEGLRRLRAGGVSFPPMTSGGERWKIETPPWNEERVLSLPVDTGVRGVAEVNLAIPAAGRIEIHLQSPRDVATTGTEATLWVVDETTGVWGYQPESLEIHLAKEDRASGRGRLGPHRDPFTGS